MGRVTEFKIKRWGEKHSIEVTEEIYRHDNLQQEMDNIKGILDDKLNEWEGDIQKESKPKPTGKGITKNQLDYLLDLLDNAPKQEKLVQDIFTEFKVDSLEGLTKSQASKIIDKLT